MNEGRHLYKKSGFNAMLRDSNAMSVRSRMLFAGGLPLADYMIECDHTRSNLVFRPRLTAIEG
jgi:hypothetical protein